MVVAEGPAEIEPAMWQRIGKVLTVGILHGHDSIVLVALGCGALGDDANEIAGLFECVFRINFKSARHSVTLAIGNALSDWNEAQRWYALNEFILLLPDACCLVPISVHCNGVFKAGMLAAKLVLRKAGTGQYN